MSKQYVVRVVLAGTVETPEHGFEFGPFDDYKTSEQCVIALASRADVRGAMIEDRTEQKGK